MFPSLVRNFSFLGVSSLVCSLFPLGPFGFCVSSFVSSLFLWALLRLSRLACLDIGLFLSLLVPGSSFLFFSFSLRLMLLVPSYTPFVRWSSFWYLATARQVGVLRAVSRVVSFSGAVISLTCIPGFRAMPVSSFTPLPRSLRMLLGNFVGVLPGLLLLYPVRALRLYLARPAAISPCPFSLLFLFVLFLGPFSEGALSFFAFSLLVHLPLLLLLGVLRRLLLLPLLPFGLIACGVLRLLGFFRIMLFSLLSLRLLLNLLLLSLLRFTLCRCSSPLQCFRVRSVVPDSSVVSYVFFFLRCCPSLLCHLSVH